jgi:hypothetical protein
VLPNVCGSSAWNLLHVTLVVPRIFGKICGYLQVEIDGLVPHNIPKEAEIQYGPIGRKNHDFSPLR